MAVRYVRSSSAEAAPMQGETIVFDPKTSNFFLLNASAAVLWNSLETPQDPDGLAARICQSFEGVTEEQARKDVKHTLHELEALLLIVAEE